MRLSVYIRKCAQSTCIFKRIVRVNTQVCLVKSGFEANVRVYTQVRLLKSRLKVIVRV